MAWTDFGKSGNAITHPFNVEYKGDGGQPHMTASLASQPKEMSVFDHSAVLGSDAQITPFYHHPILASHSPVSSSGLGATTSHSRPVMPTSNPNPLHGTGSGPLTAISYSSAQGMLGSMKSGAMSHLDTGLAALYQQETGAPQKVGVHGIGGMASSGVHANADGIDYVVIDITAKNGDGHSLESMMHDLGMTGVSSYAGIASGVIAVDKIADLGNALNGGDLGFARTSAIQSNAGFVTGQQDSAEHADIARGNYGVDGTGFRVGVLSDSFDTNGHAHDYQHNPDHMADNIASDDLPVDTQILQDSASGTDEGRAMAQLVHDIAPGAAIDFATAFTGQAGFANNIVALAQNGDSVITDDVQYYAELAYQEGPIAQAIDYVKDNYGVSYFSSAGNNGHEGLEQAWVSPDAPYTYLGETLMQFAPGQDYLPVTLAAGEVFILQWDEPGASAGGTGSASDVDLFLTNQDGSQIYAYSIDANIGGDPVEGFSIGGGAGGTYYLRVGLYSGPAPTEIKLMALGNGAPVDLGTTAGNFNNGTTYGHNSAEGANAVGAVRYDATPDWGTNPPDSESFTSAGPTRIWFDTDGTRLATPDDRSVDFSAVDGANTTFFGFDYDSDGFRNFFGTSAAAPDAAAVAVLIKEANAGLTPDDIRNLLADSALDMNNDGTPGFDNGPDNETGAGLIQADLAVAAATTGVIQNADAVVLLGTHFNDTIWGNGNANIIDGGDGNDIIHGGIRGDTMAGGAGADTFVYDTNFDSIAHVRIDTILDIDGTDTIDLSALDADQTTPGDQAFTIVNNHTGGVAGELQVHYHAHGQYAGETTVKGWTNEDHRVDVLILLVGDHRADALFDL